MLRRDALQAVPDAGGVERAREMILFLDFDGVLHSSHQPDDDPGRLFTHAPRLGAWMEAWPGVDVVISSSWRLAHSQQTMVRLLGPTIGNRVVGCTPWADQVRDDNVYPSAKLNEFTHERQVQVEAWMSASWDSGRGWVALDDMSYLFKADCSQLVVCAGRQDLSSENIHELDRHATQAGLTRARESPDAGGQGMDEVFRVLAVADADAEHSVDGMPASSSEIGVPGISSEHSASGEVERRNSNRDQGGFSMKLWTTSSVYNATGEGEVVAACISHAENAQEAKETFVELFGEFFGRFSVSVEGPVRGPAVDLLFSEELLQTVAACEGRATVVAQASLRVNRS